MSLLVFLVMAAASALGLPAAAQAASPPQGPPPAAPASSSGAAPPAAPLPVNVTGATDIEYDAGTERYTFTGPRVVVTRGDQRLEAPVVVYQGAARQAVLPEGGTVSDPREELRGDHIVADLAARHLLADGRVTGRFLDQGAWTSLAADRLEVWDAADKHLAVAAGHAVLTRRDETLRADVVTYDRASGRAAARGGAVLTRGPDRLQADSVDADLAARDAVAAGHVVLDRAGERMHGTGDRATYTGRTHTAVLSGHAVVTRGRDVVTADVITMHLDQHLAIADGQSKVVAYPQEGRPGGQGTSP